jgi:hypothetical protein
VPASLILTSYSSNLRLRGARVQPRPGHTHVLPQPPPTAPCPRDALSRELARDRDHDHQRRGQDLKGRQSSGHCACHCATCDPVC